MVTKKSGLRGLSSKPAINSLKKQFRNKFKITTESENRFSFNSAYYSPDLVFWSKDGKVIKAVIEVEQGTRKHIVGGIITADYCVGKISQKPLMLVLALTEQDRKDYLKRKELIFHYIKYLRDVVIGNKAEIVKELKKMK
jgi:hypothetical protein